MLSVVPSTDWVILRISFSYRGDWAEAIKAKPTSTMYYESLVFFYKRMRLFTNLLACMRFLPRPEDNPIEDEELVRMALQSL